MNRQLLGYVGIGLLVVAALIAGFVWWTRGAHIELRGSVLKVRTQAMDERSSVVVLDFRFVNPSDHPFIVRTATVFLVEANGDKIEGTPVAEIDARRLFQYYPLLGQKFNESLMIRDKVASHESMDRMICARFEVPESELQARQKFVIRIEDVDGAVSEVAEDKR